MPSNSSDFSVSIITPIFNDLEALKSTYQSIKVQTYPVEWVVIDSDSGEDHVLFLRTAEMGIHNLVWISEKDQGLYDGMNKGFIESGGHLVLFLNAGDLLLSAESIKDVVTDYEKFTWQWAVALAVRIGPNGQPRAVWEYLEPQLSGLALGTRTFCHQSTFYTRALLEKIMPYEITNLAADHLLNIRAFKRNNPRMLAFVTTLFKDGGISSQRPFSAAMKDLRRIRKEEKLLMANSLLVDFIASWLIVGMVNLGSLIYRIMRKFSRHWVREEVRVSPLVIQNE
jgi:glycosyltransferase involved in cell wall biosynthesis